VVLVLLFELFAVLTIPPSLYRTLDRPSALQGLSQSVTTLALSGLRETTCYRIQREHISTQSNTATHRQPVIPLLNGFNGLCKHAAPCLLTHWTTKLCSGSFPGMIGSECSQIRTSIGSLEVREPTSLGST